MIKPYELGSGMYPVLQFERRHASEFRQVVRHQDQAFAACVPSDLQVIHTNRLTEFFLGGTNGAVVLGGLCAVGQHL